MYQTENTITYCQIKQVLWTQVQHTCTYRQTHHTLKCTQQKNKIRVGTANGKVAISIATATLPIPQLNSDFPTKGYIMPTFTI